MRTLLSVLIGTLLCLGAVSPVTAQPVSVASPEEQAAIMSRVMEHRFETLLRTLMARAEIDMWIVMAREYNEDPVMRTMLPPTWLSARRTTMLVMARRADGGVDRLAVARYNVGTFFEKAWDPKTQPDQFARLAEVIADYDPQRIGINVSDDYGHADGLVHTLREDFLAALPARYQRRLVSAEALAVGWLETRTEPEIAIYQLVSRLAHHIVEEGLSEKVIVPGQTTTDDVVWWYRNRVQSLGLETWFHPSVDVQRAAQPDTVGQDFSSRQGADVIMPGDLVHMDFGIRYLGLHTDTQRNAYVLRPGETEAPEDLRAALAQGNRLQDILTSHMITGRTGNEILRLSLEQARSEGLRPSIYTHPIGLHGHASGPTIGMWDKQGGVPGTGDYPLYPNTAYAIELNVTVSVPAWNNQDVRIMLEENALFDGTQVRYIDGRRTDLLLIPRVN